MNRVTIFFAALSWLLLLPFVDYSKADIGTFSLELQENSLREVSSMFQEKTGYEISFPEVFHSMNISGKYTDTSLDRFLSRILKGTNYATIVDDNKKFVIVTIYENSVASNINGANNTTEPDNSASYQFYELEKIAAENEAEYQNFINNPESIDPSNGLTFSKVRELLKTAEGDIFAFFNNPESIDPFSGKKINELQEATRNSEEALQEFLTNSSSVEPHSGIKLTELRTRIKRHEEEIENYMEEKRLYSY